MNLLTLFKYQYDKTGTSASNLIANEVHTFTTPRLVPIPLKEGAFYTESIVVQDLTTGLILTKGVDYTFQSLEPYLTAAAGKEVAGAIQLTSTTFIGSINITYQCVGGPEGYANSLILDLIEAINSASDNPSIPWANIIGKPQRFPPELHSHPLSIFTGLEALTQALDDVTNALVNSKPMLGTNQNILEQIDGILRVQAQMQNAINRISLNIGSTTLLNQLQERIKNHPAIPDSTHTVTSNTWTTVASWDESVGNSAHGTILSVDTNGATHTTFYLTWVAGGDIAVATQGMIGTDTTEFQVQAIRDGSDIALQVYTPADATVKTKWHHVL